MAAAPSQFAPANQLIKASYDWPAHWQFQSRLFTLPPNIKEKIWGYVLNSAGVIQPYHDPYKDRNYRLYWSWWLPSEDWINVNILRTCRRAYLECYELLYRQNNFCLQEVPGGGVGLWEPIKMTRRNFDMIQTVTTKNLGWDVWDVEAVADSDSTWPAIFTDPPLFLSTVYMFYGPYAKPLEPPNTVALNFPLDFVAARVIVDRATSCRDTRRAFQLDTIILDDRTSEPRAMALKMAFDCSKAWQRRRLTGLTVLGPDNNVEELDLTSAVCAWTYAKPREREIEAVGPMEGEDLSQLRYVPRSMMDGSLIRKWRLRGGNVRDEWLWGPRWIISEDDSGADHPM